MDKFTSNIFIVKLERSLTVNLRKIKFWRHYVDDTICFVKIGSAEYIRSVFNSFYKNIQFTYELEKNAKLPFLDMFLMRNHNNITTTVYRKESNSDFYLHWDSFMPNHGREDTENFSWESTYQLLNGKSIGKRANSC